MLKKIAILSTALIASACTWVAVTPGAEKVTLVKAEHIMSCAKLGSTKANVLDKVGFIERRDADIEANLLSVAKNTAIDMGGDTVVADTPMRAGTQTFSIYKCRK